METPQSSTDAASWESAGEAPRTAPPTPVEISPLRKRFRRLAGAADFVRRYLTVGLEAKLDAYAGRVEAHQQAVGVVEDALQRHGVVLSEKLSEMSRTLSELARDTARASAGIEDLRSIVGPRFDEIDIKLRPLIAYDDESWAVRVRDGYIMIPKDEPTLALMVADATSGGLEPGTRGVLNALIRPGMTVVDVGANVGLLTLACARAAGPAGRVYAFEPEDRLRRQLTKSLHVNGLHWVDLRREALGRTSERRSFHVSPTIGHSSLYELPRTERSGSHTIEVDVLRLDDALPPTATVDVIKIDVEGAELDVLEGMSRQLARSRDIAIVAEYGPSHLQRIGLPAPDWFAAFAQQGFDSFVIDEGAGRCRPAGLRDLEGVESANLAFVRPGGDAAERLPR